MLLNIFFNILSLFSRRNSFLHKVYVLCIFFISFKQNNFYRVCIWVRYILPKKHVVHVSKPTLSGTVFFFLLVWLTFVVRFCRKLLVSHAQSTHLVINPCCINTCQILCLSLNVTFENVVKHFRVRHLGKST